MRTIPDERLLLAKSLWSDFTGAELDTPVLKGEATVDVAIIGAGFTGLSAALHLAEAGVKVVVLEAHKPGWGASGRNGGQIIPGLKEDPDDIELIFGRETGERIVRFAGGAPDVVFDIIEKHGIECSAVRSGWIQPAHNDLVRRALERRAEQWGRRGVTIDMLTSSDTARLIGTNAYACGNLDRRGGSVQPLHFSLGLARAAIGLGARIHGGSRVACVERQNGKFRLRTVQGAVVHAEQVVMCPNGYADAASGDVRRSIVPVCSVQVATEPLPDAVRSTIFPQGHVASDARRLMFYYRLSPDGRFVMGGRGAYSDMGIDMRLASLRRSAVALFPQLDGMAWTHHWGGFVAMTTDHFPHLHVPQPGMTTALGYNGRGVAMATAMGRLLALKAGGVATADLDFPVSPVKTIPMHALRRQGVSMIVAWNQLLDAWDHTRSGK
ncbi:FAD-binding oxidoreductase [Aureimonas fodinaquatilis]|uniref:FAD-binding oxidoreductase n=1 Tax=Aureimonas fodinaquatilis TaxID=2565783 RepID=A0A5B0DZY2_9HYPH|nr:FAD-binding oxidoreductase [Aureimonas fodinaquatilis]KAA0972006.1 FAD-binding oxidoreductase [Aureimonas fodinaquatilis]